MSDKAWKSLERRIARRFDTERNSKHGLGEHVADVVTDDFSIECKLRGKLPSWLKDAKKQAKISRSQSPLWWQVNLSLGPKFSFDCLSYKLKHCS